MTVDCTNQVRMWVSSDGLPAKHRARLTRLRAMNPSVQILLLIARSALERGASEAVHDLAGKLDIDVVDIATIEGVDDDERVILEHALAEVDACFAGPDRAPGNLSVVSDQVRLVDFVLRRGLCTDMDVELNEPFGPAAAAVECPLGVVARFKANGCVSNDVTAGVPGSLPFRLARRNVADLVRTYRAAACRYLAATYGEDVAPDEVSIHPRFFELRNGRHDDELSGTARFSLTGGPDSFAISLHQAGIHCGHERGLERGAEPGELTVNHVPHVLRADAAHHGTLQYEPFEFGPPPPPARRSWDRAHLWPSSLPEVMSHWDHSWIPGHQAWQALSTRERALLDLVDHAEWSLAAARDLVMSRPGVRCSTAVPPLTTGPSAETSSRRPRGEPRPPAAPANPLTRSLAKQGIVAVDGLLDAATLGRLGDAFAVEIDKKVATTPLEQFAFNLAVDDCEPDTFDVLRDIAAIPALVEIVEDHLAGRSRFVSARGYRQHPCKPLRYRAWDYHQDMKTKGPFEEVKVMVLLTDVAPDGQAMRYACGSHELQWAFRSQRQTKFSLQKALELGGGGLFVAHGPAGTCVFFDTNGIHSGQRNLSATRDVVTLNFLRESPDAFYMFTRPLDPAPGRTTPSPRREDLAWRTGVVDGEQLAAIFDEYAATPELAETMRRWTGDALELVDLLAADLNTDLDLQLSAKFEDDRCRDIGLVRVRDAPMTDVQYLDLVSRLGGTVGHRTGGPWDPAVCVLPAAAPLAAVVGLVDGARHELAALLPCEEVAHCDALLRDLGEAVDRCDRMSRLRTTAAYLYVAMSWAHRLLVAAGQVGLEGSCCTLLHLYMDLAGWDRRADTTEGLCRDV